MTDPARPANRPGLPTIAYRVGTHATFLQRMLQNLAASPLADLTTRSADDPSIAMLDAWATVSDVLTFYQERIANEGYLRTATERQSVLQLARAIGYELNPGVAANALLAFTVEDAAGAPGQAALEAGLKVLSIPGQSEHPQTFETVERIVARADWNALRARTTEPQVLGLGATEVLVDGMTNQVEPGDALLMLANREEWDLRAIRSVEVLATRGQTRVRWTQPLGPSGVAGATDFQVFALRQRAAVFGYNAPDFRAMPDSIKLAFSGSLTATDWPGFAIGDGSHIDLDALYPRIQPDSWVVLSGGSDARLYHVDDVVLTARTDYTLSAKVTRLSLDSPVGLQAFGVRDSVVFAQSEALPVAAQPVRERVGGTTIALDRRVEGLHAGQRLVVADDALAEAAVIETVADDAIGSIVTLATPLQQTFDPHTLTINANVARATHGETVRNEVLGSGRGSTPNQHFALRKPPLTQVSASTPSGAQSTLEVRVGGIQWQQAASLFGLSATDQKFAVRIEDDGETNVIFGDGSMGARLPSGTENVVATYRSGIGPDGNVRAGSLQLLQVRPAGMRAVTNPLPASGAAAAEDLDDARANAPLTILTLERVVSLQDFEDFARAFAGVGKAQAARLWNGHAQVAHITVAGAGGGAVDPVATLPNLLAAIDAVRDRAQELGVQNYTPRTFGIAAEVLVESRFVTSTVLASARAALVDAFSFARRTFGQPVSAAEIITVVQSVAGVQAVTLTKLVFVDQAQASDVMTAFLPAATARWTGADATPAELLLIEPTSIALSEMARPG